MSGGAEALGNIGHARYAYHNAPVFCSAEIVAYTDVPTYLLRRSDGHLFSWRADLVEVEPKAHRQGDRLDVAVEEAAILLGEYMRAEGATTGEVNARLESLLYGPLRGVLGDFT